jgi:hypothetical protein
MPIAGNIFDQNNHDVCLILKRHTVGGTGETYVAQYDGNGRGTYVARPTAHAGVNSQHTVIHECQEWLNQANFDRDTACFYFTYYCDKFIQCCDELEERNVFFQESLIPHFTRLRQPSLLTMLFMEG